MLTEENKKREKDVSKKVYAELSTHNYQLNGYERNLILESRALITATRFRPDTFPDNRRFRKKPILGQGIESIVIGQ